MSNSRPHTQTRSNAGINFHYLIMAGAAFLVGVLMRMTRSNSQSQYEFSAALINEANSVADFLDLYEVQFPLKSHAALEDIIKLEREPVGYRRPVSTLSEIYEAQTKVNSVVDRTTEQLPIHYLGELAQYNISFYENAIKSSLQDTANSYVLLRVLLDKNINFLVVFNSSDTGHHSSCAQQTPLGPYGFIARSMTVILRTEVFGKELHLLMALREMIHEASDAQDKRDAADYFPLESYEAYSKKHFNQARELLVIQPKRVIEQYVKDHKDEPYGGYGGLTDHWLNRLEEIEKSCEEKSLNPVSCLSRVRTMTNGFHSGFKTDFFTRYCLEETRRYGLPEGENACVEHSEYSCQGKRI